MKKVLVVSLGQLRGAEVTFQNFKKNLIDALNADFAICARGDFHYNENNPFLKIADYRWIAPFHDDLGTALDEIAIKIGSGFNWRDYCRDEGFWLGGAKDSNHRSMSALLFYLRWFLWENFCRENCMEKYSHVVISRTDFMFLGPHPSISQLGVHNVWIPNGDDFGGLNDRHAVIPVAIFKSCIDFLEAFLTGPEAVAARMAHSTTKNIESYFKLHLQSRGLLDRVARFPPIMYLAGSDLDPPSWSTGDFKPFLGHYVKQPYEFQQAFVFSQIIRRQEDWQDYFYLAKTQGWGGYSWLSLFNSEYQSEEYDPERATALLIVSLLVLYSAREDFACSSHDNIVLRDLAILLKRDVREERRPFLRMLYDIRKSYRPRHEGTFRLSLSKALDKLRGKIFR